MQAQIKKWGNSQGIRLSKEILKSAGIERGFRCHDIKWCDYSDKIIPS